LIQTSPAKAPLLTSTLDPLDPISYQVLYEHVKGWLHQAIAASALPYDVRLKLAGAFTHWLRHIYGIRAIAR